jgi:hypothetical protein
MNMRRCLIMMLMLAVSISAAAAVSQVQDSLSTQVTLRKGTSALSENPAFRASVAELFSELEKSGARLDSVTVYGGSSPDGLWGNNIVLSRQRTDNAADYLVEVMLVQSDIVGRVDLHEDWNTLYKMVESSDLPEKDRVLEIIRTKTWGERKTALRALQGGKVWEQMDDLFFPRLHGVRIVLHCSKEDKPVEVYVEQEVVENADTVQVREEVVFIKESVPMTAVTPAEPVEKGRKVWDSPWMMGVKTNLASDLITVPSIGIEAQLSRHISLDLSGWYRTDYNGVSPELRWWFGNRTMRQGSFIGVHANAAWFEMEWNDAKLYRAEKGDNWSAGMTYGYSLGFGKRDHWGLEFVAGAGYLHSVQDIWEKNGHDEWQLKQHKHMTGFGLTKFGINLTYRFSLRRYEQ